MTSAERVEHSSFNLSKVASALTPAIYTGEPGISVSVLEIGARTLLIIFLAVLWTSLRRIREPKRLLNEWGDETHAYVVRRRYSVVVLWDILLELVVLSFICLPVQHDGAFASVVFGGFPVIYRPEAHRPFNLAPKLTKTADCSHLPTDRV